MLRGRDALCLGALSLLLGLEPLPLGAGSLLLGGQLGLLGLAVADRRLVAVGGRGVTPLVQLLVAPA